MECGGEVFQKYGVNNKSNVNFRSELFRNNYKVKKITECG